jgi:hypothetical protein
MKKYAPNATTIVAEKMSAQWQGHKKNCEHTQALDEELHKEISDSQATDKETRTDNPLPTVNTSPPVDVESAQSDML